MTVLLVTIGAAVGAPLRYLVDRAVAARLGTAFPWGILLVNTGGSFVLGLLIALPAAPGLLALAGTGFCGALTTYSTFGLDTVRLLRSGAWRAALSNIALSLGAGLTAAYAGLTLGARF